MDSIFDQNKPHQKQDRPQKLPSSSELFSSAKLVADAAKSTLSHQNEKVDKAKVAGASGDLLGAASHYGKLEESSFGKYVDQAEDYLHNYGHSSNSTTTTNSGHSDATTTTTNSGHSATATTHSGGDGGDSGSGYGDYLKMAQGFLKK